SEIHIPAPSNQCAGSIEDAWVDAIFLVDASSGMTQLGLRKAEAFLKSVMRQMSVGEDSFQQSRVGIITYAAEAHVVRDLSRADNTSSSLHYDGDDDANLLSAFTAALDMFDNSTTTIYRQKVIIVAASAYREGGPEDALQAAKQFAISGGSVVTIDYRVQNSGLSPLASLATHGFAFTNDDQEVANLFNSLLHANCFCPHDFVSGNTTQYGSPDCGCYGDENIQADWADASDLCKDEGGSLLKIDSHDKQQAIDKLTTHSYWIGLRHDSLRGAFFWQDWTEAEYTRFAPSQPDLKVGDCVYSKHSLWYSAPCNGDKKGVFDHVYFCESRPCSAS
ncbi:hypothetical protein PFISCL1PPCAC_13874, partial [Pristionchus fissidentatus]